MDEGVYMIVKIFLLTALFSCCFSRNVQADILDSTVVYEKARSVYKAMEDLSDTDLDEMVVNFGTPQEKPAVENPGKPGGKLRVADFEVFNPAYRTYARVRILVDPESGSPMGAEYLYLGK
ncbi:hypothetical protein D3G38_17535 [Escherichia coli]|nr:hypothetical protein [Escherichia coli]